MRRRHHSVSTAESPEGASSPSSACSRSALSSTNTPWESAHCCSSASKAVAAASSMGHGSPVQGPGTGGLGLGGLQRRDGAGRDLGRSAPAPAAPCRCAGKGRHRGGAAAASRTTGERSGRSAPRIQCRPCRTAAGDRPRGTGPARPARPAAAQAHRAARSAPACPARRRPRHHWQRGWPALRGRDRARTPRRMAAPCPWAAGQRPRWPRRRAENRWPFQGPQGRAMGMESMRGAVETDGTCGAGARLMGKVVAKAATSPAEAMAAGTTSLSMGIWPGGGCLRNDAGAGLPPAGSAMGMVVASAACLPRHHCWDIWASISSIFLSVTARSPEDLELSRLLRNCEPCAAGPGTPTPTDALPGREACCNSAWRRRRSWSNSRLRTKSLRRLRSIISLSACLLYWLSWSASRPSRSDH